MQNGGLANMDAGAKDEFNQVNTTRESAKVTTLSMIDHAEKPPDSGY